MQATKSWSRNYSIIIVASSIPSFFWAFAGLYVKSFNAGVHFQISMGWIRRIGNQHNFHIHMFKCKHKK